MLAEGLRTGAVCVYVCRPRGLALGLFESVTAGGRRVDIRCLFQPFFQEPCAHLRAVTIALFSFP